jgi:ankyrin repeat protein
VPDRRPRAQGPPAVEVAALSDILDAVYRGDRAQAEQLAEGRDLDVFEAAALGRAERLRELLDGDGTLANAWAGDGFQPLGLASFFGNVDAARLLVERGAEVNSASRNDLKVMPLHSAVATPDPKARYEIARLLLEAGAEPNAEQQDRFTPLMAADHHQDERLRALLVEHGATR